MKRYIILCVMLLPFFVTGQTLSEFKYFSKTYDDDIYIGLAPTYSFSWNSEAPDSEAHSVRGITGKLDIRKVNFKKGEKRYYYQHKLVFDMLLIIDNQINGDGSAYHRQEGSGFTTGWIGWFSMGWNIVGSDKFCLALGGNINDYFLTNSYRLDTDINNLTSLEPQGYWFAGGPSAFADYVLGKYFLFHSHFSYSLGFWRVVSLDYKGTQIDNSYPKPHFGGMNIELQSKFGLFGGVDYNWLINRGENPNNTKRIDIVFGFRLPL